MSSHYKDERHESKKYLNPILDDPSLSEGKKFAMKYRSYKKGHSTSRPALKVSHIEEEEDKEVEEPRLSPNLVIQPMALAGPNEVMQESEKTNRQSDATPINRKIE